MASGTSIEKAGRWLASLPRADRPSPIVPMLCKRFGLSNVEAVAAIREAVLVEPRAQ